MPDTCLFSLVSKVNDFSISFFILFSTLIYKCGFHNFYDFVMISKHYNKYETSIVQ